MARKAFVPVVIVIFALIALCFAQNHEPRTAKELGIANMSQYALADVVYSNCSAIEAGRISSSASVKSLAKKTAYMAGFLNGNVYGPVKNLANAEYGTACGPNVGGYDFVGSLATCKQLLHPVGHENLQAFDQQLLDKATIALNEQNQNQGYKTHLVLTLSTTELVKIRNASDAPVDQAKVSGSKMAIAAAKSYQASMYDLWDYAWYARAGVPYDGKRLTEAKSLLKQASDLNQACYSTLIAADAPVRPLPK